MSADEAPSQTGRMLAVTTPLGDDVLLLTGFQIQEEMSRPFHGHVDMLSTTHDIDPKEIVGKPIGIKVELEPDKPRYFHGIVQTFVAGGMEGSGFRRYTAEIVPWTWFLTLKRDCCIYQNKSAKDILEAIFNDLGYSDFETSEISDAPPSREFCVQFRESCFDFISRLMEEEGIFYYFRHEESKHVLVLANAVGAYKDCEQNEVKITDGQLEEPHIVSWSHRWEVVPGKVAVSDHNFETSATALLSEANTKLDLPDIDKFEVYEYPGAFSDSGGGDRIAKIRMEEHEAGYSVATGGGSCVSFMLGGKFKIKSFDADEAQKDKSFVITTILHQARDDSYMSGGHRGEYWNAFTCIPDDVLFRPPRITKRPATELQTATVVGPDGEESYTDKYGRVKVKFHWDREEAKDDTSSCYVRLAQIWAGNKWGAFFYPRIGQDVIVTFLDGDPDRPIVIGSVCNDAQMPAYEMPGGASKSGFKTRSTPDGADDAFNELSFDDKKDEEKIFIHACKDFEREVKNNDSLKVGLDGADDGSQIIEIKKDRTITVKEGKQVVTVEQGDETLQVKQGKRTVLVDTGDNEITVKSGNYTAKVSAGKFALEAGTEIELKVGGNSIKIDSSGVTIKGTAVKIEATGSLDVKGATVAIEGSGMAEMKSPMTTVKGDGMLTLKGGVTMIN